MMESSRQVERSNDTNDESVEDDGGSTLDPDECDSENMSDCTSSFESNVSIGEEQQQQRRQQLGESESEEENGNDDYSIDDDHPSREDDDDAAEEALDDDSNCDEPFETTTNYLHSGEEDDDGQIMNENNNGRRGRVIILILSTLLSILLLNFGYQLLRIFRFREASSPSNFDSNLPLDIDVASSKVKSGVDPKRTHRDRGKKKFIENHDIDIDIEIDSDSDSNHAASSSDTANQNGNSKKDNPTYEMPQHPSRIYTHAALSAKNYRAGGVLSDDMLRRYEEDGVLVIRNLVSPKLLDRLDEASRMLIDDRAKEEDRDEEAGKKKKKKTRGKQFHLVKNGAVFLGVPPPKKRCDESACSSTANGDDDDGTCDDDDVESGDSDTTTDDDHNAVLSSFRDLAMYSKIPRVAASLLRLDELREGGERYLKLSRRQKLERRNDDAGDETNSRGGIDESVNLRICRDIFLTKDDDPHACGWHVDDTGFWPTVASDPGVNAWIALDDMPWPRSSSSSSSSSSSTDSSSSRDDKPSSPVATFTLSLGSHRAPWRREAYRVTGSTHTVPPEGYRSASDLIRRRSGSGTCNIRTSAPHLYEKLEENRVMYDLKRGDVIFHDRWVFHRTVTVGEYESMSSSSSSSSHDGDAADQEQQDAGSNEGTSSASSSGTNKKIFRRYSIRYAPGSAVVPPGYGVEPSVLHDEDNANRTLDDIVERSGLPWYPKVWPRVVKKKKKKPIPSSPGKPTVGESESVEEEEIKGLGKLVHEDMPRSEELQKERKKEIQRLVSMRGGQ